MSYPPVPVGQDEVRAAEVLDRCAVVSGRRQSFELWMRATYVDLTDPTRRSLRTVSPSWTLLARLESLRSELGLSPSSGSLGPNRYVTRPRSAAQVDSSLMITILRVLCRPSEEESSIKQDTCSRRHATTTASLSWIPKTSVPGSLSLAARRVYASPDGAG